MPPRVSLTSFSYTSHPFLIANHKPNGSKASSARPSHGRKDDGQKTAQAATITTAAAAGHHQYLLLLLFIRVLVLFLRAHPRAFRAYPFLVWTNDIALVESSLPGRYAPRYAKQGTFLAAHSTIDVVCGIPPALIRKSLQVYISRHWSIGVIHVARGLKILVGIAHCCTLM